ncbi:MAG: hypothetical protein HYY23_16975 [Verrucomicrobia bacterium]|nr:hypothetical protein [Verrucomicrobiota bacterium]
MTLTVLVEKTASGQFRAVTWQPIALSVEADSPANAVNQLKQAMEHRLSECEVVELNIQSSRRDHAWLKYAGVWKEHPEFDAFQEAVTEYRAGVDSARE